VGRIIARPLKRGLQSIMPNGSLSWRVIGEAVAWQDNRAIAAGTSARLDAARQAQFAYRRHEDAERVRFQKQSR
jgi:hypothetical protein